MRKGLFVIALISGLTIWVSQAAASKQVVDYFGTEADPGTKGGEFTFPRQVAVNSSGAGPAARGEIYVVESLTHRVQRFERNEQGTPSEPYDDTYHFVGAWGADVVQPGGVGDKGDAATANFERCAFASQCKEGVPSGGNGTPDGNGSFDLPEGIAVDQDTGDVYVSDIGNNRVNVYDGAGNFLRSFGWDVVRSGPGKVPSPAERQQLTISATGGKFSLILYGSSTGPTGRGTVVAGSKAITGVKPTSGAFAVGQGLSVTSNGEDLFPFGTTITGVSGSTITASNAAMLNGTAGASLIFGHVLPSDISATQLEVALNDLPSVGGDGGAVTVTGGPGDATGSNPYVIDFAGSIGEDDLPLLEPRSRGLVTSSEAPAKVTEMVKGGTYEVCVATDGDICKAGSFGAGVGQIAGLDQISGGRGIAVSQPDGNPSSGSVYLADPGNLRVGTYDLSGSSPSSIGSAAVFDCGPECPRPTRVAIDARGILYASSQKNNNQIERYDTANVNGGGVAFLAPISAPPLQPSSNKAFDGTIGLAVDPDSDGPGPDTDTLYVRRNSDSNPIQQFGPVNQPGLTDPPSDVDDEHGITGLSIQDAFGAPAVDEKDGRLYVPASSAVGGLKGHGVYVLDNGGGPPSGSLDGLGEITSTSATINATINPNGAPPVSYHLEYSLDGVEWISTPKVVLGSQETPQSVSATLSPPGTGLAPGTSYQARLVAAKPFAAPLVLPVVSFTTLTGKPAVETTGSPIRTATTARLDARVNPRNSATEFHFEYGDEGPCSSNSCIATTPQSAGSENFVRLVSQSVTDLMPGTTYHYRVVADNAAPGGSAVGADMAVTTRSSDAPLSHGSFAGPPRSDRAWEQVSVPDSGGNPVSVALGISTDGNRVIYQLLGGNQVTDTGNAFNQLFAQRGPDGWITQNIYPTRDDLVATGWARPFASEDLETITVLNTDLNINGGGLFQMSPGAPPRFLYENPALRLGDFHVVSDDGSRVLVQLEGSHDPSHPTSGGHHLYDVTSGSPQIVSLLPDGSVPACGIVRENHGYALANGVAFTPLRAPHWISADGRFSFFPSRGDDCSSEPRFYVRDLVAKTTISISGPSLSGPSCGAALIRTINDAAYFWTKTRLIAEDTASNDGCAETATDGDVYRYALDDGSLTCVTCLVPGLDANVVAEPISGGTGYLSVAVAEDGSRVYFKTESQLLPGVRSPGIYRVETATDDLAYVASSSGSSSTGDGEISGNAINPDGSTFIFKSDDSALDALGGQQNGGTVQYYRYDDHDHSLVCVSCPQDGSGATSSVAEIMSADQTGPNTTALSRDGETFAFGTPVGLLPADQNAPGPGKDPIGGNDIYEWRDGRLLLITDGLTTWPGGEAGGPFLSAVSSSGDDVFFSAPAQYTPDALDGYRRLYTAHIGGGFVIPGKPKPCPLEACQGIPKGAPEDLPPSTTSFRGSGNLPAESTVEKRRCRKGKRKIGRKGRVRCVGGKQNRKRHRSQRSDPRENVR